MFEQESRIIRLISILLLPFFLGASVLVLFQGAFSVLSILLSVLLIAAWGFLFILLRVAASVLDGMDRSWSRLEKRLSGRMDTLSQQITALDQSIIQVNWGLSDCKKEISACQKQLSTLFRRPESPAQTELRQEQKRQKALQQCQALIRKMEQISLYLASQQAVRTPADESKNEQE